MELIINTLKTVFDLGAIKETAVYLGCLFLSMFIVISIAKLLGIWDKD